MKLLVLTAALLAVPTLAAAPGPRAAHLQGRINQGVSAGELTRGEAARLQHQQNRLERELARDRKDGGGLSAHERAKLQRDENRLSRHIAAQKHDGQQRR